MSNAILAMLLAYGVPQGPDLDQGTTPLMLAARHANIVQVSDSINNGRAIYDSGDSMSSKSSYV